MMEMDSIKMMGILTAVADNMNSLNEDEFKAVMGFLYDEYARTHKGFDPVKSSMMVASLVCTINEELGAYE